MSATIYFISGLGADRRAFRKLVFPESYKLVYLDWIPAQANESLSAYADRLASAIDTSTPFYLIGLSFGGMIVAEIAKKLKPLHSFIISSTPTFRELPWYYRLAGKLRIEKAVPASLIKNSNTFGLKFLGAKTEDELALLKQLIVDSDPYFIKWALTCIVNWDNVERASNITHIHGSGDKILPMRFTSKPDVVIKGAGHFMVYANAEEIMGIILPIVKSLS